MTTPTRACALLLGALAALAAPASGQSLLASRGLGYTLEPIDARARALGGVALGIPGINLSLVNPAEMVGVPAPALSVAFQPDHYDAEVAGQSTSGDVSRFPLIHVALPVGGRGAVSVGYGSFLDQRWQARVSDTVLVGSERRAVEDRFVSEGGISRLRLAAGYRVTDRLSLAVGADIFSGVVRDTVSRAFVVDSTSDQLPLGGTGFGTDRSHRGLGFTAGVRWVPADPVIVSASVSGGGDIEAEGGIPGEEGTVTTTYANPLTVNAGASARIAGTTTLAVAGRWTGWGAADEDLAASGGARDVKSLSAGVEYEGFSVLRRVVPLRLGGRMTELPFRWGSVAEGLEFPTERALSGGLGVRLAGGAALADLSAERGWRGGDDAGIDESFWRVAFSLTLLAR